MTDDEIKRHVGDELRCMALIVMMLVGGVVWLLMHVVNIHGKRLDAIEARQQADKEKA